jgi:hypothetical protein
MRTIFRCGVELADHLLGFSGIRSHSVGTVEFETELVSQVNEEIEQFYNKRRRARNGAINGAIRRSHPTRNGAVISTPADLLTALTNGA